ncbi:MAG: EamA family transporter [Gaiellaceae bacterium]
MLPAVLALGASVAWGIGDFIGGLKSRALAPLAVLAIAQPVGFAAMAVIALIHWEPWPGASVLFAMPAAVLGTLGLIAFYRGMAAGVISLVAPIAATGALLPVAFGLATGERPSPLQLTGIALAIGGAVVTSYEPRTETERARLAAGIGWALLAAVAFGGYFVPMHEAAESDFVWATFVFRATSLSLVAIAVLVVRPRLPRARRELAVLACIGLADTSGNVLFAAAASRGLVSVVSVLASLYPVVTVVLARVYLRERVTRVQEGGAAATLGGVVLVSAG